MAKKTRILIVEDDQLAMKNLEHILTGSDRQIHSIDNGPGALKALESREYDLVLTDLRMKKVDGMEILSTARELHPDTEVIMITAYATVSSAIEAMKKGAFHYIPKPYNIDEVRAIVRQALEKRRLKEELKELKREFRNRVGAPFLVGKNRKMQELHETILCVAPTDSNILIMGETGTGKELVARAIHYNSNRAEMRFLPFNCGAFTEELVANELFGHEKDAFTGATRTKVGLLEAANGGTVFLDEIGDMPASMQVKLVRAIEEKSLLRVGGTQAIPVDIRVLAATNKDLKRVVEEGHFRQDLYYRLNVVSLFVPPLAERKDDIPLLAHHFVRKYAKIQRKDIQGITQEMMDILLNYPFPGNVRELENIIERAVTLENGPFLTVEGLPEELKGISFKARRPTTQPFPTLEENERDYINWVLEQTHGNKTRAAEILNIDRVSLWRKLKRYGIED
ncbi:MAG: sigma-54 dependent transcriptional regulator [Desulfobacteraceae bacterium]|jgi:DNA-binding NtrC family response regulator